MSHRAVSWFQVKSYLKYLYKSGYRKGHGIHPPFAFDLVRHYFYENTAYYHFITINQLRKKLLRNNKNVKVTDLGAGSKCSEGDIRKVSDIIMKMSTPKGQGELISRLVACFQPQNILELGTSLGIGTLYLAMPNSKAKVYTIEGCQSLAAIAKNNFQEAGVNNIEQIVGSFSSSLPKLLDRIDQLDMIYIDGNHKYDPTIEYFNACISKVSDFGIFVLDDIHWSKGMEKAWKEIVDHKRITLTIETFRFGLAFIKPNLQKQHYLLRWP